jgi:small subunit ribosomal protein S15Ae
MAREMEIFGGRSYTLPSFCVDAHVYSIATCPLHREHSLTRTKGYIGEFEEVDDHRNGKIVIQLNGRLNKTGVISPRYNVALRDLEKWVVKLLPSRQFGYIVLTTSSGIMDHEEARRKHVSGKIIGFFY